MASPKTGGQFYVETNRQAAQAIATAHDSGCRCMDEMANLSRVYFGAWASTQQAALETTFRLQNSTIQASRTVLDAAVQANRGLFEEWTRTVAENQTAATRMVAAGLSILRDSMPRGAV